MPTRAPLSRAMAPRCLKKALGAKEAPITVIVDHLGTESLTCFRTDVPIIVISFRQQCPLLLYERGVCAFNDQLFVCRNWLAQAFFDRANRYGRSRNMEHFIASDFVRIGVVADS